MFEQDIYNLAVELREEIIKGNSQQVLEKFHNLPVELQNQIVDVCVSKDWPPKEQV